MRNPSIHTRWTLWSLLVLSLGACGGGEPNAPAQADGEGNGVGSSNSSNAEQEPQWNVVFILLDTLRADGLGCYGNPRPTSPRIDALAAAGTRFERAWAVSPGTASSHASMFSSTYPETHGVWNRAVGDQETMALNPNAVTMAEAFRDAGYRTTAIADGGYVSEARGLDQGFDTFSSFTRGGPAVFSHAQKWLGNHGKGEKPFFLFVHTYETHVPYVPMLADLEPLVDGYDGPMRKAYENALAESQGRERLRKKQKTQAKHYRSLLHEVDAPLTQADKDFYRALYDAEVVLADRLVGDLLDRLEELDLRDHTLIVLTSDHGEEFWEHGKHGHLQIHEEQLHIPLILQIPGQTPGVVRKDVLDHVDFLPSLLAAVGLPKPATAMGRDLRWASTADQQPDGWAVGQNNFPTAQTAMRQGDWRWMHVAGEPAVETTFDLAQDRLGQVDVTGAGAADSFAKSARAQLEIWREACRNFLTEAEIAAVPLDNGQRPAEEVQAELEQLGYVGD